jgi:hypothetical protein
MTDAVLDLITDSLVALTAIQQGDTLNDDDANLGFRTLNFLIDRANADRMLLHAVIDNTLTPKTLSANVGRYTIGVGGDINQPRPVEIQSADIVVNGIRHDLNLMTAKQWAAIREKSNSAIVPTDLYCDYRWPVAALNLNPLPLCTDNTLLELFYWEPLPQFAYLTDPVDLPPAYRSFLKFNLALELALPFMKQPSQLLMEYAVNAKADVRAFNLRQMGADEAMAEKAQASVTSPAPQQQVQS